MIQHARLLELARNALDDPDLQDSNGRNGLQCLAEASLSDRLDLRYEMTRNLVSTGVNVNNYDRRGSTVLMAFVAYLPDGEDDSLLQLLLVYLISHGANLHWRNRQGETALHIAVRLGRKVATKVLLENGANVHARTAGGNGVLAVGQTHYLKARENPQLYASIMACMALAMQYKAVAAPTLVQEWSAQKTFPCPYNWSDM